MDLQSSLAVLKGLGPKSAEKFHRLGIYTIEDLLLYYPFRYAVSYTHLTLPTIA